ncbi:MAG: hypothetical protein U0793_13795 [Gemmataceae bacterium]
MPIAVSPSRSPPIIARLSPSRRAAKWKSRGWDYVDVVFVTGDAYVDHPSFAMAILHRVLEAAGFRVAMLSQPDWKTCAPWRQFGRPRLFFAISAGNMDSLINHYTANKKVRNDDAYSPGGKIGLRPDRATLPYCHRAREAFPGVPIIAGGVEASLRRLAHYDYWSDTVRRSILLDSKADLVVHGMGEQVIVEIAKRLAAGKTVKDLRDLRGVAYVLGASETPPREALSEDVANASTIRSNGSPLHPLRGERGGGEGGQGPRARSSGQSQRDSVPARGPFPSPLPLSPGAGERAGSAL